MITNNGLELIADLVESSGTHPTHLAVGTGTTTPVATDTTLETETGRYALDATVKAGARKVRYRYELDTTEENGNTLTEVGVFNAGAAGDILNRTTYTGIAKDNTFALRMEVELEFKRE